MLVASLTHKYTRVVIEEKLSLTAKRRISDQGEPRGRRATGDGELE